MMGMNNRELQAAFDFEPADLEANRSGALSPAQREKILTDYKKTNGDKLQTGAFFLVFSTLMVAATVTLLASLGWLVFLLGVMAVMFYFMGYNYLRGTSLLPASKYLARLQVQKAQGPADFSRDADGSTLLNIGSENFSVDASLEDELGKGGSYVVYFYQARRDAPDSLLSIEALPGH